jgi:hypothetical protein
MVPTLSTCTQTRIEVRFAVHSSRLTPTPARPARTPGIQGAPSGGTAAFPLLRRGLARSPAHTFPAQPNMARRPKRSSAPRTAPARSRGGLARRPGVAAARRASPAHQTTSSSTRRPSHGDGDAQGHGRPKNAIRRGTAMLRREGRHSRQRVHGDAPPYSKNARGGEERKWAAVLTVMRRCRRGRLVDGAALMLRRGRRPLDDAGVHAVAFLP